MNWIEGWGELSARASSGAASTDRKNATQILLIILARAIPAIARSNVAIARTSPRRPKKKEQSIFTSFWYHMSTSLSSFLFADAFFLSEAR